jgi:hypothetical protein
MQFRSTIELGGKTATGFEVPGRVVDELGAGKRPAVQVTVNGHRFRSTVAVMGGRFLLPLNAQNRAAAGVAAGDDVTWTSSWTPRRGWSRCRPTWRPHWTPRRPPGFASTACPTACSGGAKTRRHPAASDRHDGADPGEGGGLIPPRAPVVSVGASGHGT